LALVSACSSSSAPGAAGAGSGGQTQQQGGGAGASVGGATAGSPADGGAAGEGGGTPQALGITRLRAEYRENPIGIASAKPRFDWLLASDIRGQRQTAYRILVSSSEAALAGDHGDLWDSGKISSDQSTQVEYGGAAVASRTRAFWKVQVWDKDDQPSAFSKVAFWERGPDASDWQAKWIAATPAPFDRDGVDWIWFPEGAPATSAPPGDRYFRKTFTLPSAPLHGSLYFQVDDTVEFFVNGQSVGSSSNWQIGQTVDITSALKSGSNVIAAHAQNGSGAAGLVAALDLRLATSSLFLQTDATWKSANSADGSFSSPTFDDLAWSAAMVAAKYGSTPWGDQGWAPPRYFRREFTAPKAVTRARVYATALGLYELWLNGSRVGDEHLTPGWTDYGKRVQVQTYDVTSLVKTGANALGAILADGWFGGKVGFRGQLHSFGAGPDQLRVQLELEYDDGSKDTLATDSNWKFADGPIQSADLLDGETYDARLELGDWSKAPYDDSKWQAVSVVADDPARKTVADATSPVIVAGERKPMTVKTLKPGVFIYDFGQNLVGWARLSVMGLAGTALQMRFAEVLNPDGSLYTDNLRSAKATDRYYLRGGATETFEPRFTTHGFRYLELSGDIAGLSATPDLTTVTAIIAHSDTPLTNTFQTSSDLVNQLESNIVWGQLDNFVSVPTDCPQRDERLGWMGDAQIFVRTATINADVASFYSKFVRDMADGQNAAGAFADTSPRPLFISDAAPAWGDAGVIIPWTMYLAYGDTRVLAEQYDSMQKWVAYIGAANPDFLWKNQRNSDYGDWLNVGAETDHEVLATAFYAHSVDILAKTAKVLGKSADADKYSAWFGSIRKAFATAYLAADGTILSNTQTAYALAMRFGLLDDAARKQAASRLAADVDSRKHLSTGFLGVAHLLPALTAAGRTDAAYQLLNNQDYPSWGYQIKMGATTIWERWDGIQTDGHFQTPAMNSFNHYSFGSVGEWLNTTVAGIDWDEAAPGYKHFFVRPSPGGGLTSANAAFDSIHGRISSAWSLENGVFSLNVGVPVGASASVVLPFTKDAKLDGVVTAPGADGSYSLDSGTYVFTAASQ